MTNTEIKTTILNKLKELGFKLHHVNNVDNYFIMEGDKDSITHFYIKGLPHWKFGLWVNCTDKEDCTYLFTQYDTQIDKFKPSRSHFCVELSENDINKGYFYETKSMIKHIKRHPMIAYNESEDGNYYEHSYLFGFIKNELIKTRLDNLISKFVVNKSLLWLKFKMLFIQHSKIIKEISISDFEKECSGWTTDERYKIKITFAENSTDDMEVKLLNFWFHKTEYGKRKNRFNQHIVFSNFNRVGLEESYSYTTN